ncbi:hypothetical protein [Nocardia sp. NPDC019395]|uniref:hypothetical protein n=1 Tax=Nocardia sp. NPDC019395 TaxID=3154686 RepID=UPI0033CA19C3
MSGTPRDSPLRIVHLPSGFTSSGEKVRACCTCGWRTTPRVSEARALSALLNTHGHNDPLCQLCRRDYSGLDWFEMLTHHVEILTEPASRKQFLVCRGLPKSCREGAAQNQVHLDRAAADLLDIELPRPTLRVVR